MTAPAIEPSVAGVRRAVIDHLRQAYVPVEMWLIALAVTTGTNLLTFATVPAAGERPTAGFIVMAVVRVVAVLWLAYALIRRIAGVPRPFAPGWPLLRFAGLMLVLAAGFGLFSRLADVAAGGEAELADTWIAHIIATAIWAAFTIGLLAWEAALAIDDRSFSFKGLLARQQGRLAPLWLAFAALVLPFAAIHFALTLIAVKLTLPAKALAALAFVDGAVSAIEMVATCALVVVAWKIASPLREGGAAR
ncbi:hypothetical protein SAMN06295912_11079 [Sphingomonas laterariae]|uniref:Uncharacterized protein n=1 Tax=Edaphosphingomonas laterariae TaxID=861865 RepID=A0A239G046_9SPHN|nr:hypothetical protein [Sphingomonas laterariae]SNS61404.1 hypothetical protein SAMN06295912_11079 [Sphingomonas laterariae]